MRKPVNAIRHLSWPEEVKPQCWTCWYWTGARSSGQVICSDVFSMCSYRRVETWRVILRWLNLHRRLLSV
jgi:hypothetical protein